MLLSMTGYGEASYQSDSLSLGVELRAVNNRYLKLTLRAAEPYNLLEPEFEKVARRHVRRGTLQVHFRCHKQLAPQGLADHLLELRLEQVVRLGRAQADLQIAVVDRPEFDGQMEGLILVTRLAVARHAEEHAHPRLLSVPSPCSRAAVNRPRAADCATGPSPPAAADWTGWAAARS